MKMTVAAIILVEFFLYIIIYLSVSSAIISTLNRKETRNHNLDEFSLVKLRDMGVINSRDLEDIRTFYNNKDSDKSNFLLYFSVVTL